MYIEKYSVENFQKFQKFQKGSKQAESAKKQPSATLFKKCGFGLDSTPHPSMEKSTLFFWRLPLWRGVKILFFPKWGALEIVQNAFLDTFIFWLFSICFFGGQQCQLWFISQRLGSLSLDLWEEIDQDQTQWPRPELDNTSIY